MGAQPEDRTPLPMLRISEQMQVTVTAAQPMSRASC